MKKVVFYLIVLVGLPGVISASRFKISDAELNKVVLQSKEVSSQELSASLMKDISAFSMVKAGGGSGEKKRGGFLLRSFFCGFIALHRYYMGTNNKFMWAMYFCIPVVGEITNCVDFWGSVFNAEMYKKYENNDKYIVWLD
jgi:hypothetical protein